MSGWLYVNGGAELCVTEDEARAKLAALIKSLEAQGYVRKDHPTEADRITMTHSTKQPVEAYVHDEGPEA